MESSFEVVASHGCAWIPASRRAWGAPLGATVTQMRTLRPQEGRDLPRGSRDGLPSAAKWCWTLPCDQHVAYQGLQGVWFSMLMAAGRGGSVANWGVGQRPSSR